MVRKRLVLNFYGFEPSGRDKLIGRLLHCAAKTAQLWDFKLQHDAPILDKEKLSAQCNVNVAHEDWQVETKIVQLGFGDIISSYFAGFFPVKLVKHIVNYVALLFSPLVVRFFKTSKLYGVFFLFPLVLLAVFLATSLGLAVLMQLFVSLFGVQLSGISFYFAVGIMFIALCRWPGQKMHLFLSLAHWSYARDVARQSNPAIEERYGKVADLLIKELTDQAYDEIVISGHSFGSTWATIAMGQALLKEPDLFKDKNVVFLRLGSSLMNTALFHVPSFVCEYIQDLANQTDIFWHEFQTKDDVVSFYKTDFIKHLGLQAPQGGHVVSRVNFKHSMDKKRYRKIKRSFYDVHRQYGLYQDKRVSFDYLIRLLGPVSSRELAQDTEKFSLIHDDVQLF